MGWKEYYEKVIPDSFIRRGEAGIIYSLKRLAQDYPQILDQEKSLNFVLGGFHPFSGTARAFLNFCRKVHPHQKDQFFFVDMNRTPLESISIRNNNTFRIQSKLEASPFAKETIDFIFLDCTPSFMKPEQIAAFAESWDEILTKYGLAVVVFAEPLIKFIDKMINKKLNRVPYYVYSARQLREIVKPNLKSVLEASYNPNSFGGNIFLMILARHDSPLPEHQGLSFCYEEEILGLNSISG